MSTTGWVENRFLDHIAYERNIPNLWNKVRDNIGQAVEEFNNRTPLAEHLDHRDCMARGKHCIRLHKAVDNSEIEVFLNETSRLLKTATGNHSDKTICKFRLTGDRKELEFFQDEAQAKTVISADEACESAIGEFIFNPFPTNIKTG